MSCRGGPKIFLLLCLSMKHIGSSMAGIKLSINEETKNVLKRHVYVCHPWPGPIALDSRCVRPYLPRLWVTFCLTRPLHSELHNGGGPLLTHSAGLTREECCCYS